MTRHLLRDGERAGADGVGVHFPVAVDFDEGWVEWHHELTGTTGRATGDVEVWHAPDDRLRAISWSDATFEAARARVAVSPVPGHSSQGKAKGSGEGE